MKHSFEYMQVVTSMDSIDVQEIGECCLHAFNDNAEEFYILVTTDAGITRILTVGPLLNKDVEEIYFKRYLLAYNEQKIIKIIDSWIKDNKKAITQIFEEEKEDVLQKLKEIDLLKNL